MADLTGPPPRRNDRDDTGSSAGSAPDPADDPRVRLVEPPVPRDPDEVLAEDVGLDPALVGGYPADEVDAQPGGRNPVEPTYVTSETPMPYQLQHRGDDGRFGGSTVPRDPDPEPDPDKPRHPTAGIARPVYDWPAVKRRYVEGVKTDTDHLWPSLEQVGNHFGINVSHIRSVSSKEGWVAARKQWQAQVEQARQTARAAALVKDGINLDNAALGSAKLGLQLAQAKLQIIGAKVQAERSTNATGGDAQIDALEMTRLAQAVDLWHKIGLRAIGDPVAQRVEFSGPGGAPIEITAELKRDDPTRITNVLAVLQTAGLADLFTAADVGSAADAAGAARGRGGVAGIGPSADAD